MELQIKIPRKTKLSKLLHRWIDFDDSITKRGKSHSKKLIAHCHWLINRHLEFHGVTWVKWRINWAGKSRWCLDFWIEEVR